MAGASSRSSTGRTAAYSVVKEIKGKRKPFKAKYHRRTQQVVMNWHEESVRFCTFLMRPVTAADQGAYRHSSPYMITRPEEPAPDIYSKNEHGGRWRKIRTVPLRDCTENEVWVYERKQHVNSCMNVLNGATPTIPPYYQTATRQQNQYYMWLNRWESNTCAEETSRRPRQETWYVSWRGILATDWALPTRRNEKRRVPSGWVRKITATRDRYENARLGGKF